MNHIIVSITTITTLFLLIGFPTNTEIDGFMGTSVCKMLQNFLQNICKTKYAKSDKCKTFQ